ncbi:MAG: KH domain-containing protein [Clostridia bacterium]|nr:KH domain-containing protein [Clostridia bacterium]
MEELLKYVVTSLVDKKDDVEITFEPEGEKVIIARIVVDKADMGKVIGRNGKVASAIRTLVKSVTLKSGKRYIVKIDERKDA